ncbi:MAG: hypothetical protein MK132_17555 [Lentisphaerales bacterium]|nr:hypothetical protein [Lentisphaerales bacterium]
MDWQQFSKKIAEANVKESSQLALAGFADLYSGAPSPSSEIENDTLMSFIKTLMDEDNNSLQYINGLFK